MSNEAADAFDRARDEHERVRRIAPGSAERFAAWERMASAYDRAEAEYRRETKRAMRTILFLLAATLAVLAGVWFLG